MYKIPNERIEDGTYRYRGNSEFEPVENVKTGYWVSSTSNLVSPEENIGDLMVELAQEQGTRFVGIWTADNGDRYVDKSHHVEDVWVALAAARHWNQKAIWIIDLEIALEIEN